MSSRRLLPPSFAPTCTISDIVLCMYMYRVVIFLYRPPPLKQSSKSLQRKISGCLSCIKECGIMPSWSSVSRSRSFIRSWASLSLLLLEMGNNQSCLFSSDGYFRCNNISTFLKRISTSCSAPASFSSAVRANQWSFSFQWIFRFVCDLNSSKSTWKQNSCSSTRFILIWLFLPG